MEQFNAGESGGERWPNSFYKKRPLPLSPTKCHTGYVCPYHLGLNSVLSKMKVGYPPVHLILVNPYGCDISLQPRNEVVPSSLSYGRFPVCYQVVEAGVGDQASGDDANEGDLGVGVKEENSHEDVKLEDSNVNVKEEGGLF